MMVSHKNRAKPEIRQDPHRTKPGEKPEAEMSPLVFFSVFALFLIGLIVYVALQY
jgi:hypothetical protein